MGRSNIASLNALRAFEAAGRLGRMVAAAEELHVTHGAVSRQIKQLEEALGIRLFEGPKNRPVLTEAGRHMLPLLTSAFDQIDRAIHEVADTAGGVLTVSCPGTLMMRWLIPRLHDFNDLHPDIEVRVVASDGRVDLARAAHDIAIRLLPRPIEKSDDMATAVLFDEAVGPVMTATLAEDAGVSSVEDLRGVRLLNTRSRPESWHHWLNAIGAQVPPHDKEAEYEHFYFLFEAVLAGLGVGLLPWQLAADEIGSGRLVAPFGFSDNGQSQVILWRRGARARERTFVDWAVAEGKKMAPPPGA